MTVSTNYASVTSESGRFGIRVYYDQESGSPARVFITLSKLIEAFEDSSKIILKGIPSVEVEPSFLIENVEKNCLTAWLRNVFRLNKPTVAFNPNKASNLLNKVQTRIIQIGESSVSEEQIVHELDALRNEMYEMSPEDNPVEGMPIIVPPTRQEILGSLGRYQSATKTLEGGDVAKYVSSSGAEVSFDFPFEFTPGAIKDVLTRDEYTGRSRVILKVKKPDYLGSSMWEFKLDKLIDAKISDEQWLNDFRSRKVPLFPEDSIVAELETTTRYDVDGNMISQDFNVVKVLDVRRPQSSDPSLFES